MSPFINNSDVQLYLENELKGNQQETEADNNLDNLLHWLCTTPKFTIFRINTLKTNANEICDMIIHHLHKEISYNDKNEVPDVKCHPILLDAVVVKHWKNIDIKLLDKQVIVDAACGAAVLRGAHVYAPGVMGMPTGVRCGDKVSVFSDRLGKCKKGLQKPFLEESRVFVGNGIVHMERKHLYGQNLKPVGIAIEMIATVSGCPVLGDNCLSPNLTLLQNLPSILCCHVLNPQENETILDMCAAPGNKTSHIAMLMKNQGTIIALDKTESKVNNIVKRCQQFSLHSVHAFACDATKILESYDFQKWCSSILNTSSILDTFDRILLDAPCSALGQRPQLINRISVNQLKSYPPLQRKLFHSAVAMLKPGGIIVYSTCTITMAENEGLVHWALKNFPNLELERTVPMIGGPGLKNSLLSEEERLCVQRFGPPLIDDSCDHDTVGFFLARFRKKSTIQKN
ncbi:putative methyltransferase NSUN6 [Blattella germanica]|nr:putative methyltransferase NSUN6 [Blattella germanica]